MRLARTGCAVLALGAFAATAGAGTIRTTIGPFGLEGANYDGSLYLLLSGEPGFQDLDFNAVDGLDAAFVNNELRIFFNSFQPFPEPPIAAAIEGTTLPEGISFDLLARIPVFSGAADFGFSAAFLAQCRDPAGTPTDCGPNNQPGINTGAFFAGASVPEPAALALFGLGAIGLLALRRAQRR